MNGISGTKLALCAVQRTLKYRKHGVTFTFPKTNSPILTSVAFLAATIFMNVPTVSAGAASFCTSINLLVDNAHSNFSEIIIEPERKSGGYDVTLRLEGAKDCTVIPLSKSKSYHCTWKFPHRATRANATFEMFERELKECIGDRAVLVRDQPVNHPDFYDSRIYQLDQANVTVSLKDKSALGRTFVFVWVRPR